MDAFPCIMQAITANSKSFSTLSQRCLKIMSLTILSLFNICTIVQGANIDSADKHGISPLLAAIWEGHTSCVKFLVEKVLQPTN